MLIPKITFSVLALSTLYGTSTQFVVHARSLTEAVNQTQCDEWVAQSLEFNVDDLPGLSEVEYYNFLNGAFDNYFIGCCPEYTNLPLIFRYIHKTLSCTCQYLGGSDGCCEGDDAAVPLDGFALADSERSIIQKDYRGDFCQQITHAMQEAITQTPTASPTVIPTASPTVIPTASPTTSPTANSILPPPPPPLSPAPSATPTISPIDNPSDSPTDSVTPSPVAAFRVSNISFVGSVGTKYSEMLEEQRNSVLEDLRGGGISVVQEVVNTIEVRRTRRLAETSHEFNIASVTDIECPDDLVYAKEGDPCIQINVEVVFEPNVLIRTATVIFRTRLIKEIDETGSLYNTIVGANANTGIIGLGSPGAGIPLTAVQSQTKVEEGNQDGAGVGIGIGAIIAIIAALLILLAIITLVVVQKRKRDEDNEVREFAGEAALDEEAPPPPVEVNKEKEVKREIAPPEAEDIELKPTVTEPDGDSVSSESSGWSDSNTNTTDVIEEGIDPQKKSVASTLAAMGVASTVTTQLLSADAVANPALTAIAGNDEDTEENWDSTSRTVETPQPLRNLAGIRLEVESLAKRATPGKDVNELMIEYKGREDELIQHLRGSLDHYVGRS